MYIAILVDVTWGVWYTYDPTPGFLRGGPCVVESHTVSGIPRFLRSYVIKKSHGIWNRSNVSLVEVFKLTCAAPFCLEIVDDEKKHFLGVVKTTTKRC